jgi:hypothetical protein
MFFGVVYSKMSNCEYLMIELAWNLAEEFRLSQPIQVNWEQWKWPRDVRGQAHLTSVIALAQS